MDRLKFGLIGYPIAHSASPAVFAAGYQGRPYSYDLIEGEDFEQSWRRFIDEYDGINVTAPFKEPAFAKADIRSPECEDIGATNLVVKTPEGTKAYNSDYYGIVFSILIGCGVDVSGLSATPSKEEARAALGGRLGSALIVGCGGAGKAAVAAAVNLGLKTTLMNRSFGKACSTAERAIKAAQRSAGAAGSGDIDAEGQTAGTSITVRPIEDFVSCFHESDLVVYAIPCPIDALQELADGPAPATAEKAAATGKLVIEANYRNPSFTPDLIARIRKRCPDVEFVRGNLWHLYQAWSGYILFTGETPDLAAMAEKDK